jgi:hypothetical protein
VSVRALIELCVVVLLLSTVLAAQERAQDPPKTESTPWVLAPLVSSSPKLGTSLGAIGAYATTFDPGSRLSLLGLMAQYTSTESIIAAVFARTSFAADHHRIVALAVLGNIKNDTRTISALVSRSRATMISRRPRRAICSA